MGLENFQESEFICLRKVTIVRDEIRSNAAFHFSHQTLLNQIGYINSQTFNAKILSKFQ
jgi:hypothetical protein